MRCFWILSDDKTIREISVDEYREMAVKDRNRFQNTHLLAALGNDSITLIKGSHIITLPVQPLRQILNGGETTET